MLLYDLTSTYFENDTVREAPDKRQYGYSRDKQGDCRQVQDGRYLLHTNLSDDDPTQLWTFYIQLTEVEQAFKELKYDLSIRRRSSIPGKSASRPTSLLSSRLIVCRLHSNISSSAQLRV